MTKLHRFLGIAAAGFAIVSTADAAAEARVTRIVREVNVLPDGAPARPAALNENVREDAAVRTGDRSRSELTFPDLTITRLGANSIYSFNKAGRNVQLQSGSILLRVPQGSGGANIRGAAVTVAVTGTTLILETARGGASKLIVLEGRARLSLVRNARERRDVLGGQMLEVPAGATTLGQPVNIDLSDVMKKHPLITGFSPLPSRDLIAATARDQGNSGPGNETVYQGQPVSGPVAGRNPRIPLPSISIGGGFGGGTTTRPPRGQQPPRAPPQQPPTRGPDQQPGSR
jgi:hypothetical protein